MTEVYVYVDSALKDSVEPKRLRFPPLGLITIKDRVSPTITIVSPHPTMIFLGTVMEQIIRRYVPDDGVYFTDRDANSISIYRNNARLLTINSASTSDLDDVSDFGECVIVVESSSYLSKEELSSFEVNNSQLEYLIIYSSRLSLDLCAFMVRQYNLKAEISVV